MGIKVPRLAKGKGYAGPEFYGCMNTGMRPSIFHSRKGFYIVGPELRCRDAMRWVDFSSVSVDNFVTDNKAQRVYIYKSRKAAVNKFMVLCGQQILNNWEMRQEHAELARKANSGDLAAALRMGNF